MKYSVFFILLLSICGCASSPQIQITKANVGVLTLGFDSNNLCHKYEGLFREKKDYVYPVKFDIDSRYQASAEKAIKLSGNKYVNLGVIKKEDLESYFIRADWDHSLKLTPEGVNYIKEIQNKNNLDYIVLPWIVSKDKNCIVSMKRGPNLDPKKDQLLNRTFYLNVKLHILQTTPITYIDNYMIGGNFDDTVYLTIINELNPQEIELYTGNAIDSMSNQLQLILEGKGKGK